MKQFKTSTGQDLPKVINWLANKEHERLGYFGSYEDKRLLREAFEWFRSNVFEGDNFKIWDRINENNFQPFYDQFPICKNSKGQILPDDIQIEIIEERLRQGLDKNHISIFKFNWFHSFQGHNYWSKIYNSDYPTQSEKKAEPNMVFKDYEKVFDMFFKPINKPVTFPNLTQSEIKPKLNTSDSANIVFGSIFKANVKAKGSDINQVAKPEHPITITDQKAREICAKYFNCNPNEIKII